MAGAATIISSQTVVNGRITGEEDLDVFGTVRGRIESVGDLRVDSRARVEADVVAHAVEIMGIVVGSVTASTSVRIHESAMVDGDITTPRLLVSDGAKYRGYIDMGGESATTAKSPSRSSSRPSPKRAARSRPKPPPPPPEPAAEIDDADDEPALPEGGRTKKVKVKRRG